MKTPDCKYLRSNVKCPIGCRVSPQVSFCHRWSRNACRKGDRCHRLHSGEDVHQGPEADVHQGPHLQGPEADVHQGPHLQGPEADPSKEQIVEQMKNELLPLVRAGKLSDAKNLYKKWILQVHPDKTGMQDDNGKAAWIAKQLNNLKDLYLQ